MSPPIIHSPIRLLVALIVLAGLAALGAPSSGIRARLWLRYDLVADAHRLRACRDTVAAVSVTSSSSTGRVIEAELRRGLAGLLGREPVFDRTVRARHLLVGTPERTPAVAALGWNAAIDRLGPEGFLIRSATSNGHAVTVITAATDAGLLYGTFHFLRLMQTGAAIDALDVESRPRIARRLLNHWDNLDGSVERGYAGASLWWPLDEARPDHIDDRIIDYARANASLGINGAVINNVNADPRVLTAPYARSRPSPRGAAPLRHSRLSVGQCRRAAHAESAGERRSARSRGGRLVARQGRRDLRAHSGLRRVRGQGQQ